MLVLALQYRMGRDVMDMNFLGPRIMDKLVLAFIVMSLYWRVGANQARPHPSFWHHPPATAALCHTRPSLPFTTVEGTARPSCLPYSARCSLWKLSTGLRLEQACQSTATGFAGLLSMPWALPGAPQAPSNVNNITAVLFLWTILPGYAAASYMPTIVLERPLYVR